MVESANAAARIGALMLSVLVFAAMWESDSKPQTEELRLVQRAEPVRQESATVTTIAPEYGQTRSLPLPAEIAPGHYRVVDSAGTVSSLVVQESIADLNTSTDPLGIYSLQHGDRTLYFIRVEDPTRPGLASAESAVVR
jgi:hypothetical protein